MLLDSSIVFFTLAFRSFVSWRILLTAFDNAMSPAQLALILVLCRELVKRAGFCAVQSPRPLQHVVGFDVNGL